LQFQAIAVAIATYGYPAERFVTLEKLVQGPQFVDHLSRKWPAHMVPHEAPEPLAQGARLFGDLIQFLWRRLCSHRSQPGSRNKAGLSQPRNETVAAIEQINGRIDRRCDGVQEIEAG